MIDEFKDAHSFLSNFHPSKIYTNLGIFPTAEHFYQAGKTDNLNYQEQIRQASSPGRAKRMGRSVELRPRWEMIKVSVMRAVVRAKFHQNADLAKKLLETGDVELVEGNDWDDNEWGNCTCEQCKDIEGKNLLGKVLMQIRSEMRA